MLSHQREHVVLNPTYRECLAHYDGPLLPAAPYRPKHKAKAEVGVLIALRWVLFRLRHRTFHSLAELNEALTELRDRLNTKAFKAMPGLRLSRFEAADRPALRPLPATPYVMADWVYGRSVPSDYHVTSAHVSYSVPCRLVGERVDLRVSSDVVEVFHAGKRVALHIRCATPGAIQTVADHRPVAHQHALEGEPRALLAWSARVGPATTKMVEHHLINRRDAANGRKVAKRLQQWAREYGEPRIEAICAYAWARNITALRSLVSILRHQPDRSPTQRPEPDGPPRAPGMLRGPSYFGGQS